MPRVNPACTATPSNLVDLYRHQRFETERPDPAPQRAPDRVEISERAQWMERINRLPSVREEMVKRVRAQIHEGTYDVGDKFDAALDRMVDELALDPPPNRFTT